jgi:hypothetical protein
MKDWRLISGNVNGVRPFVVIEKLGGAAVKIRHLETGSTSLIETNVEWHRYEYRNKTISTFKIEFGAARVEFRTASERFKTTHFKPGGHGHDSPMTMVPYSTGVGK